jgi:hypothetical protein
LGCGLAPTDIALAGVTPILTSDGQPYTVVFGIAVDPQVSAVAAVFSDGTPLTVEPVQGGFMIVRSGIHGANTITAVNPQGNTVIQNIPQVPAG